MTAELAELRTVSIPLLKVRRPWSSASGQVEEVQEQLSRLEAAHAAERERFLASLTQHADSGREREMQLEKITAACREVLAQVADVVPEVSLPALRDSVRVRVRVRVQESVRVHVCASADMRLVRVQAWVLAWPRARTETNALVAVPVLTCATTGWY
eukprot:3665046-Rhodomonas_salina.1